MSGRGQKGEHQDLGSTLLLYPQRRLRLNSFLGVFRTVSLRLLLRAVVHPLGEGCNRGGVVLELAGELGGHGVRAVNIGPGADHLDLVRE